MLGTSQISDKDLQKQLNQRLCKTGVATQTPVSASVHNGVVTVTGAISYDYQRKAIHRALQGLPGVRSVVDALKLRPATAKWQ